MSNVSLPRLSASELIAVDNVVSLPDPRSGILGDLFAAAGAPGQSHELTWEFGARTAFNTQSVAWSHGRRRLRRSPAFVAVAAIASLLVTTTGLAAATGVPAPAARVVDHVLRHINITIQPPGTTAAVAQSPSSSAANAVATGSTGQIRSGSSASCALTSHQTNLRPSCGLPTSHPDRGGRGGSSRAAGSGPVGGRATTSRRSQSLKTGNASSGTHGGGSLSTGTGSNHGTSQGGGTGGTGGQSTGTGTGTGSNRGGNKGTGSNRGGNKGTGRGGRHGTGTKRGTGTKHGTGTGGNNGTGAGSGNGSGAGVGTGPSHHHHGTGATGATSPSQPSGGLQGNP
jgi:hypothetical protein